MISSRHSEIIVKLYRSILEYQALAVCHLNRGTIIRMARNIPKFDNWINLQNKINKLDTECKNYHAFVDSSIMTTRMAFLFKVLNSQGTVLEKLMQKQDENAEMTQSVILSISDVIVGQDLEDVRNRLGSKYWDSGQWLLEHEKFLKWAKHPSGVLWLRGPVGVGKTCLTSIVVQHHLASEMSDQVAFFYCSQQQRDAVHVLRSILAQLSYRPNGNLAASTRRWFEESTGISLKRGRVLSRRHRPKMGHKISITDCVDLIITLLHEIDSQTTIVIDALDECRDAYDLLNHLEMIQKRAPRVKIFLTSRLSLPDDQHFDNLYIISHFDSAADIESYVKTEIHSPQRRARSGMTDKQASQLEALLVRRAESM